MNLKDAKIKTIIRNVIIDAEKEKLFSKADELATKILESLEGYDPEAWGWTD